MNHHLTRRNVRAQVDLACAVALGICAACVMLVG